MEVCGMSTGAPRRDALAPLPCTPACKVAQRNARFASALGLAAAPSAAPAYDAPLFRFAATDRRAALAVQDALGEFVQSPRAAAQLRPLLSQLALRAGTEPPRVSVALLDFATRLAHVYGLDVEPCTEQGAVRMGTLTHARGADVRVRRARGAHVPTPLLTEYMATHAQHVKQALASPAASPRPAWGGGAAARGASPAPPAPARFNALALTGLPAHLVAGPCVAHADAGARGARRAPVVARRRARHAARAARHPAGAAERRGGRECERRRGRRAVWDLAPSERRLVALADEIRAVLGAPVAVELVGYDARARRVVETWAAARA
ncbi:hypothetical protein CBS14141_002798 [Malassezia furfur]|nr:hypothetical protein CBS14141_002798 [Malassezia furfur]